MEDSSKLLIFLDTVPLTQLFLYTRLSDGVAIQNLEHRMMRYIYGTSIMISLLPLFVDIIERVCIFSKAN